MIVRAVRLLWNGLRLVPGARTVGGAFLQTGSGRAFARWMMRPLSANSAWQEESLADLGSPLHSSTYGLRRPYPRPLPEHYAQVETAYAERRGADPARIAFVSANMGNYESPIRHEHLLDDADYVLVSDTWPIMEGPTRVVPADYFDSDPVRMARFVKTHPQLYAPAAQVVVWIDSNVVVRGDLGPLLQAFIDSGRPVGAIPHPERTNLAEESRECIRRRKDDATVIREQMARYDAVRFETDALVESNLLLLRMDMPQTRRFLSCWWVEIDRGSRRDQLSFNYAARQAGIDLFEITQRPDSVRNHPLLAYLHHDANPASEKGAVSGSATQSFATVRDTRIAAQADAEADIVICVHDALDAVKACLDSVVASRNPLLHRIIIVDDASSAPTAEHLRRFAEAEDRVLLLRNETALRYTRAANAGLRASTAPFVILLNSDTVVGPNFVEKLADAAATTEGVGIVGPLSNAAGMQSLPFIDGSGGQSPNNALPGGFSVADMDRWCEAHSPSAFPRVPLVHGFCFAITRAAIDAVGLFDEDRFPQGYGEEDDFCLRAAAHGVGLALATNTFVFHNGSKSYGQEQRSALLANARQQLVDAFGDRRLYRSVVNMQDNPLLKTMRAGAARIETRR